MRFIAFLMFLILSKSIYADSENKKYFAFIGNKISIERVVPKAEAPRLGSQFIAKYKIVEAYKGAYSGNDIEFSVFDHYGEPPFSKYENVLLYVILIDGKYYHSEYQFTPLYKTKDGKWAGAYSAEDYNHAYNRDTNIVPVKMDFYEPVLIDISNLNKEEIQRFFPEPFYKISGHKAIAIYGNYLNELFLLKKNGVLKARGEFQ